MNTNNYGSLFIPIVGFVPIRSKFWFVVLIAFGIASECGTIPSVVGHLYSKLLYTTMIISPEAVARKAPQGSEVEVRSTWDADGGEVVLEFPDSKFEIRYTTRNVDGKVPFSVEKFETTLKGGSDERTRNEVSGSHHRRSQGSSGS